MLWWPHLCDGGHTELLRSAGAEFSGAEKVNFPQLEGVKTTGATPWLTDLEVDEVTVLR